ncbi:TonB-dependent siderophore receptor [Rhodopseudomonas sp.]|uniref:TonB-dependent siderophore receptor n=1 Tax=Rhodopseudomonas sp. TaxID=1078 RepID=UPI0039E33658
MHRFLSALCAASVAAVTAPDLAFAQANNTGLPTVTVEPPTPKPAKKRRAAATAPRAAPRLAAQAAVQAAPPSSGAPVVQTTAGPVQGIRAITASSATRTDTPIEQIPQSIQVVPRQLIEQQGAVTVSEAVQNVSNVEPVHSLTIANTDLQQLKIRGFGAELWRDGMVNVYNTGDRDGLVNVERIEVLKGPNAILYGGGPGAPIGGALNVVSKLPTDKASKEFGIGLGSYQYWNPFFDINQPLNQNNTALFRITGEYTGNKSYIDVIDAKRYSINPTLTLTNREDTTLTIQGFLSRQQQQAYPGLPVYGTILGDFRVNRDLFIGPSGIEPSYSKMHGATVTLDHEFNSMWSANIKARWSQSQFDQMSQWAFGGDATGAVPAFPPSTWLLSNLEVFQKQQEFTVNPSVKAKFDTAISRNTLLIGADYSRVTDRGFMTGDNLGNTCFLTTFACPPATVDLQNPVFTIPYTRPNPSAGAEYAAYFNFDNTYVTKGGYAQLQSSLYDRVHVLAGARLANIDISYTENALVVPSTFVTDKTKLLPRAGVVVDLVKGLSAYASYSEGMRWAGFTTAVVRPEPELSQQVEAGLKYNINSELSGSLAVFEIHRDNVPVTIALGVAGLTQQKSRGFETDMLWQPSRNWSFLGSYGYTDATFAGSFVDSSGVIPGGNKLPFVPEHSGRVWANYKFDPSVAPGWSVGAGVYAASSQYVDNANLWKTDGYYTVDAKIGYEKDGFRAFVALKNLTGETYFTPYAWLGGQVAPGAPRMVYGQLSYRFN